MSSSSSKPLSQLSCLADCGIRIITAGPDGEDLQLNRRKKTKDPLRFYSGGTCIHTFINTIGNASSGDLPPWATGGIWDLLTLEEASIAGEPITPERFLYCEGPIAAERFGIMIDPPGRHSFSACQSMASKLIMKMIDSAKDRYIDTGHIIRLGNDGNVWVRESAKKQKELKRSTITGDDAMIQNVHQFFVFIRVNPLTWCISWRRMGQRTEKMQHHRLPLEASNVADAIIDVISAFELGLQDRNIHDKLDEKYK